jgi:hypothetical protein
VRLLKGEFATGDRIRIDVADNELMFTRLESVPPIPVLKESEPAESV